MHTVRILNRQGDEVLTYDPTVTEQVDAARERVDNEIRIGGMVWKVAPEGNEQIGAFDPTAAEIVVSYPMVGG